MRILPKIFDRTLRTIVEAVKESMPPPVIVLPENPNAPVIVMPTIDVGSTMEGDTAAVQNAGTRTAVKLDFTIPRPKDGMNVTDGQVAQAVEDFLRANPPQQGQPGNDADPPTPAQIADQVTRYLQANPPKAGEDGKSATQAMVDASVSSWLRDNPPAPGKDGDDGDPGSDGKDASLAMVDTSVAAFLRAYPPAPGQDGKSVELQKTSTAIQWRTVGGIWADLVALLDLKGAKGDAGSGVTTLKAGAIVSEAGLLLLALGVRKVPVAAPGAVVGGSYVFVPTSAYPAGFDTGGAVCVTKDSVVVNVMVPAITGSYSITGNLLRLG